MIVTNRKQLVGSVIKGRGGKNRHRFAISSIRDSLVQSTFLCLILLRFRPLQSRTTEHRRVEYWAIRSLVLSHCPLICLLGTACFAYALCSAHLLARSLTRSGAHGKVVFVHRMNASVSYPLTLRLLGLYFPLKEPFVLSVFHLIIWSPSHPKSIFLAQSSISFHLSLDCNFPIQNLSKN